MGFTLPAPHLRQALQTAQAFMADFDLTALYGVHVAPAGDGLVAFSATDRFIASRETLKVEGDPFEATIPCPVVAALVAALTPIGDDSDDEPLVEPYGLATVLPADGGKVTVRLAGFDTVDVTFEPAKYELGKAAVYDALATEVEGLLDREAVATDGGLIAARQTIAIKDQAIRELTAERDRLAAAEAFIATIGRLAYMGGQNRETTRQAIIAEFEKAGRRPKREASDA